MNRTVLEESITYIEDNLANTISAKEVAENSSLSSFHFQRLFSKTVGISIKKYILARKLSEAARELIYTDKSITEIAYCYAFETVESFARAFKRRFGTTPSSYRKFNLHFSIMDSFDFKDETLQQGLTGECYLKEIQSFTIVTIEHKGVYKNHDLVNKWYTLFSRCDEVKNISPKWESFGLIKNNFDHHSEDFNYICGKKVDAIGSIPQELTHITVHGGLYAGYYFRGGRELLTKTYKEILKNLIPMEYELDQSRSIIEYNDESFSSLEISKRQLLIPIRSKHVN